MPASIVSKQAWDDPREYKVHVVRKVMRRLIQGALSFPNFDHLRKLDDGLRLVQEARQAVEGLRKIVEEHCWALLLKRSSSSP